MTIFGLTGRVAATGRVVATGGLISMTGAVVAGGVKTSAGAVPAGRLVGAAAGTTFTVSATGWLVATTAGGGGVDGAVAGVFWWARTASISLAQASALRARASAEPSFGSAEGAVVGGADRARFAS